VIVQKLVKKKKNCQETPVAYFPSVWSFDRVATPCIPPLINTDQCTDLHALALDLQSYDWISWKPDAQKGVSTSMWSLLLHVPEWPPILVVISPDAETSSRFGGRTDAAPCW